MDAVPLFHIDPSLANLDDYVNREPVGGASTRFRVAHLVNYAK
jgi:hypothetical protein